MCGITGFVNSFDNKSLSQNNTIIQNMTNKLIHRGPDFNQTWTDDKKKVFLGHARLSVLDLSINANQPMKSSCGRFIICFNGEIYNHLFLRKKYNLSNFKGNGDTETLLKCFQQLGVVETCKVIDGMFAICLFDNHKQKLYLIKDRAGEKPIYYHINSSKNLFLFGSEIKSIVVHPDFKKTVNELVLEEYFKVNYVPGENSIYKNLFKVKPANILEFSIKDFNINFYEYWKYSLEVEPRLIEPKNEDEVLKNVESLLMNSVNNRMLSDVPIGCFLSGGIDSSLVASLMKKNSNKKINTFSIGFLDSSYNEAPFAKKIANYLGTDHHELYLGQKSIVDIVPTLWEVFDEPFADSSQIPTMLLSKFAKKKVTVALTGDGADELFCGYDRYQLSADIFNFMNKTPKFLKKIVFDYNNTSNLRNFLFNMGFFKLPILNNLFRKFTRLKKITNFQDFEELYINIISNEIKPSHILNKKFLNRESFLNKYKLQDFIKGGINEMLTFDFLEYLPNDILTKVDRTSMHYSLETRTPFLEKNLIKYVSKVPNNLKIKNNENKYILKKILEKYLPKKLFDRKKMGFAMPVTHMINRDLKEWSEELLSEKNLKKSGYFKVNNILEIYKNHKNQKQTSPNILWSILMFQSWYINNFK